MRKEIKSEFKKGLHDGFPLGLGYLSVSFAFGVQASLLGVPVLITLLISMTNLTSAGQLAGVSVVAAAGSVIELILIQLVINSRYFLMSLTLTQKLDDSFTFPKRLLTATFITDEIFAVAAAKPYKINVKYFAGLSVLPYIGWALGTLLGALAGDVLPQRIRLALGIALYAMFLAIIVPPAKKSRGVAFTVAIAIVLSCILKYVPYINRISEGFSLIIGAIISSFVAAAIFPVYKKKEVAAGDTLNDEVTQNADFADGFSSGNDTATSANNENSQNAGNSSDEKNEKEGE